MEIFRALTSISRNSDTTVYWLYQELDEDLQGYGEDLQAWFPDLRIELKVMD